MVKQKKVRTPSSGGAARKRTNTKTRKTVVPTFKRGLLLIRQGLERSKLKSINGQANLALKLGRSYFGQGSRKIKLPASVPLKTISGGFLISALAGIASAIGIVSGISSIVSNYKKIKSESERLKIEKRKGEILENYFMTTADRKKGAGIVLKKGKKGFFLKLKKCSSSKRGLIS
jgi:hypothetical protein